MVATLKIQSTVVEHEFVLVQVIRRELIPKMVINEIGGNIKRQGRVLLEALIIWRGQGPRSDKSKVFKGIVGI